MNEDVEIISKSINWEEVRCRAAIAFMPSIMQVHELKVAVNFISKRMVAICLRWLQKLLLCMPMHLWKD